MAVKIVGLLLIAAVGILLGFFGREFIAWSRKEWRGIVYPLAPGREWAELYATVTRGTMTVSPKCELCDGPGIRRPNGCVVCEACKAALRVVIGPADMVTLEERCRR